jgi:uncharacterized protein involved in outer membrane biogenesis
VKKVLWGSFSLVIVLAAAILIGPGLIDWNTYKSEISSQVKKQTGRNLTIDGDIRISVLPAPAIVAANVTLSNVDGASTQNMISLKSAEVRIALAPLLGGQVKVETVKLIEPIVQLEVLEDGRKNWDIQLTDSSSSTAKAASSTSSSDDGERATSSGPSIVLDNFTIENATLIYQDKTSGVEERISNLNAEIAAASLQGPFQVRGGMRVRDIPLSFDVNVGELIQGRTLTFNVNTGIVPELANFKINGTVLGLPEQPRFKGKFKGEGKDLLAVLKSVGAEGIPTLLAQQFSVEGDITGSAAGGEVNELKVSLADSRIGGDIAVDLGAKKAFSVRLNASQFDIDRWLAVQKNAPKPLTITKNAGANKAEQKTPERSSPATIEDTANFQIPPDISGALIVSVDALKFNNGLVRDMLLNVDVAEGQVTLSQLSAGFPGGSEASLTGTLSAAEGSPSFNGELETTINDLRGVLSWLGTDIASVPQDRLRKLNLNTKLTVTDEFAQVTNLDLRFDSSHLTGAATIALRKRPSFGVNVLLDRINLDAYLPNQSRGGAKAAPASKAASTVTSTSKKDEAKDGKKVQAPFAGLSVLGSFDANIKAQVKSIVYQGEKIKDAEIDATLFNSDLEIRRMSIARLAGASASMSGNLNDLTGLPKAKDFKVKTATKNLAPLLTLAGVDLGLDPRKLGAFSMTSTLNGNLLKPSLDTAVKIAGADIKVNGKVGILPVSDMFDLKVAAKHKSLKKLSQAFGGTYVPSGNIGGLNISTRLSGNPKALKFSQLSGTVGTIAVAGSVDVDVAGAKPQIKAALNTGAIDIGPYLPAQQNAAFRSGKWGQLKKQQVVWLRKNLKSGTSNLHRTAMRGRWPADPIDLTSLNLLDADVSLTAPVIVFGKYLIEKADVGATLKDGMLNAHRVTGRLFGGTVNAVVTASGGATNSIGGKIKAAGVDIADALRSVVGEESADGKLAVDLNINASGKSIADFVATLDGTGAFKMADVDVSKQTKGSVFAGVYGLISALNQFGTSKKSKLADVAGSFAINDGTAQTNDLTLTSGLANGVATGVVDLPNWKLDVSGKLELIQSALSNLIQSKLTGGKSEVPFSVKGSLDQPKVNVDMGAAAGAAIPIPGAGILLDKAPKKIGNILKGVLGGGGQAPSTAPPPANSGDAPPPPRNSEQQPTQQQIINPKKLLESLFN